MNALRMFSFAPVFFLISVCMYVCFECTGSVYRSFFHFHHKICVMKSTFLIQIGLYFNMEQFGVFREQGGSGSDYFLVYFYLVRHLIHSFAFVFFYNYFTGGYANISHGKIRVRPDVPLGCWVLLK